MCRDSRSLWNKNEFKMYGLCSSIILIQYHVLPLFRVTIDCLLVYTNQISTHYHVLRNQLPHKISIRYSIMCLHCLADSCNCLHATKFSTHLPSNGLSKFRYAIMYCTIMCFDWWTIVEHVFRLLADGGDHVISVNFGWVLWRGAPS